MISEQLTQQLMALPLTERVVLAQALWQSTNEGLETDEDRFGVAEALQRDAEFASGSVIGLSHEEVMRGARRALGRD